jgi:4-amino-4-deoxy-L-arabinose transferase-like glycosyltransferase
VSSARRIDPAVLAVVVLTGAALALRLWGIQHGLPHPTSRPDEREVLDHTAQFATGDWNPRWFIYPPFYFHLTWLWDEAVLAVWRLWRPRPDYFELLQTTLSPLLLGGRMLTALLGALTVPLAWAAGRELGGRRTGLVAAVLVAGSYLLVRDSHALKPDVPLAAGVLASLWLMARWVDAPTVRRAVLAGVAIGVATAFKYNAILLLAPILLADRLAPGAGRVPRPTAWLLGITGVLVFVALCPHLVLDFPRTYETYLIAKWNVYVTRPESLPPADAGWLERAGLFLRTRAFGYHLSVSLRCGCGLLVTIMAVPALTAALRREAPPFVRLGAAFAIFYYLVAGASPVKLARYLTPIVPLLLVLIADLVVRLADRAPARLRSAAVALLTVALVAEPLVVAVRFDRIASEPDTRVLAADWLARLPHGGIVALIGSGGFPLSEPVLPPTVRRATFRPDPAALRAAGVTHVITVWHHALGFFARGTADDLGPVLPTVRLVAEFSPYRGEPAGWFEEEDAFFIPFRGFPGVVRPGPLIRIYATAPPA